MGDGLDAPGAGAEEDDLALAGLVDHLLVELADAAAARAAARRGRRSSPVAIVREVDAEEAAIGDRATGGDGHRARVAARLDRAGDPVPDEARPELGELVGGVVAGEHADDGLEGVAPELGVVLGSPDEGEELVERPGMVGRRGHDLLGQHVERVARHARGLDRALVHPPGDHRRLEQVAAVLGEDDAARRLADLVAGPPDALEPAGDRASATRPG